ncbi:hypothetical protein AAVH_38785, partial [Aphelenchoides avenae]
RYTVYWIYFLSACNLVQFAALLGAFVLLPDQNRLGRVRTFVGEENAKEKHSLATYR